MKCRLLLLYTLICIMRTSAQKRPVDYVNPMIGTHDSRPMQFPGASMPFGMVKLSPDNQKSGWKAAHDYNIKNIAGFNFIHDYQMTGFYVMPITGKIQIRPGEETDPDGGYRSRISNSTEVAHPGYYSVHLEDYNIKAEITATTRVGVQCYTFPKGEDASILYDFEIPYEDPDNVIDLQVKKVNAYEIEGYIEIEGGQIMGNTIWLVNQYRIYFVAQFSEPMQSLGGWQNDRIEENIKIWKGKNDVGCFIRFGDKSNREITSLTAISLVSQDQARLNLETETQKYRFNFSKYAKHASTVWNKLLSKIEVKGGTEEDKIKFYTNLYRTYATRTIWSDVNGKWCDMNEGIATSPNQNPVYGCDAFWGMKWNLNGLWSIVNPSLMNSWVNSLLEIYKRGGWLPKGPTAGEYTAIMTSSPAVCLITAAFQQEIRDYDVELAYEAVSKIMKEQGKVHRSGGYVGNRWGDVYQKYGYVPYESGPASATMEMAFQDWCVAQMAKELGKVEDYRFFMDRSMNYQNHFDFKEKYARPKSSGGTFLEPFRAFSSKGFIEGNGWQYTYHVPHDVQGVINFLGEDEFIKRLEWGFTESQKSKFNATGDQYAKFPINHGNQPNMQASFLFNYASKPWLTQKWSRKILDVYYGATALDGWPGDEDEGQMGAWYVMSAIGLFQMQGGCGDEPLVDLTSPLFEEAIIHLENGKKLRIKACNNSKENIYIQSALWNGKEFSNAWLYCKELQKGGTLEYTMGNQPNKEWGIKQIAPSASKPGNWRTDKSDLQVFSPYLYSLKKSKFMDTTTVVMKANTKMTSIHYTTDGSEPTHRSPVYDSPILLKKSTEIKALVFSSKKTPLGKPRKVNFEKVDYEKNMATGQKVTASGDHKGYEPENAVDGLVDINKFWDCSPYPQWWQIEWSEEKSISEVQLFTYWGDGRYYQYTVDFSTDGKNWETVIDAKNNTTSATNKGYRHTIKTQKAKFIRVNFIKNSSNSGVHLVEFRTY